MTPDDMARALKAHDAKMTAAKGMYAHTLEGGNAAERAIAREKFEKYCEKKKLSTKVVQHRYERDLPDHRRTWKKPASSAKRPPRPSRPPSRSPKPSKSLLRTAGKALGRASKFLRVAGPVGAYAATCYEAYQAGYFVGGKIAEAQLWIEKKQLEGRRRRRLEREKAAASRGKARTHTPDAPQPKHRPAAAHGGLVGPVTPIAPPPRRKPAADSDSSRFPKQDPNWSRNNGWSDNTWSTPKKRK